MEDETDWVRWEETDTLFEALMDLDPGAWDEALDRAAPDPAVRRTVLRLLHATREPQDTDPAVPPRAASDALEALAERQLPEMIGPFRPLRELGSGGMGTVYLAERAEGDFRQRVAVKILRRGLDTDDLLARFRAERRILAGLRHPNVAHLVDGGSTSDGRPWLAMEYVEGVPLDAYCASGALDERARVRLVREVATAVREVHRNLVVHRDIKPSNVLVTPEGVPKLLDFGIAKLVSEGDESADAVGRTRPGHRMLTPQYAAPEQRAGLPVTAATDVYQLGALLRAVLAGKAAGDLQRIVAMATHEAPLRRYRDAGALVEELDRWLGGRPVVARADTVAYRTTRFLQRHRWVAPAAVVVAVLVGGWGWSLVRGAEALRAERDRAQASAERARVEQGRAESATAFLVELFRSADPAGGERGDTLSARTLLTRGADRIREGDGIDPAVGARLLVALSEVASALGMLSETQGWFDEGIALATRVHGAGSAEVASLFHARATHLNRQRGFEQAAEAARTSLEIRRGLPDVPHDTLAANLMALAVALAEMGDGAGSREAGREAVALHEAGGTSGSAGHMAAMGQLAYAARRMGDEAEAETQYRRLLELQPPDAAEFRTSRAGNLNNLAQLLVGQGRLDEAEPPMRESLEILKAELDPSDRTLSVSFNNLVGVLARLGHLDEALVVAREHLDLMERTFPGDHWRVGSAHGVMATVHERQGLWAEVEAGRAEEARIHAVALGPDHSWTTLARIRRATALAELGRFDEARGVLDVVLASIPRIDDIADVSGLADQARELGEALAAGAGG
jgi:eukaryotic-like serine/threonine-protein kinase